MSNLKVTNIQSKGTGFHDVVSFQNASGTENGTLCRAWVNFDGGTGTGNDDVTIRESFNVSSVNDAANGTYDVSFTNAMTGSSNYAILATAGRGSGTGNYFAVAPDGTDPTTNVVRIRTTNTSGGLADANFVSLAIFH